MARKDEVEESWQAVRAERDQRVREKKHRHRVLRTMERQPERAMALEPDVNQIVADFKAPDEATRGKAVRQVCPCRMGWEVFQETMEPLKKMTKDPSPYVRAQALHVFEDAYGLQSMESRKEKDALDTQDRDAVKRARQEDRQLKRETTNAFSRRPRPR
jgi:hypothetical protein